MTASSRQPQPGGAEPAALPGAGGQSSAATVPATPPPGTGPQPSGPVPPLGRQLAGLGFDIGAPIAVYYLLRGAGVSSLAALAAGAVLPALSATWALAVKRRADSIALVVLATMVISIALSVLTHDPRFLVAKDGLITGLWGLWFVASVRGRRPAAYLFARPLLEGRRMYAARDWEALWRAEPRFRRIWRVSSVIWGTGMLADAAVRMVMAYTLPVSVVPGLGGALWPVTFVILQVVTNIYYHFAGLNQMLGARWLNRRGGPAPVSR